MIEYTFSPLIDGLIVIGFGIFGLTSFSVCAVKEWRRKGNESNNNIKSY